MTSSTDWTLDPFANGLVAKKPENTDDRDLWYAIHSVVNDIQRSGNTSGTVITNKLDAYFQINAPLRARVERHIRHRLEQLVLGNDSSITSWLSAWANATSPPSPATGDSGSALPPAVGNNPEAILSRVMFNALPIATTSSDAKKHMEDVKKALLKKSSSLTAGATATDLDHLAMLLDAQNIKLQRQAGEAFGDIRNIRNGLIKAAVAAGIAQNDAEDLYKQVERASTADEAIIALQAAVDKVRKDKTDAIEKLKEIESLTTAINDTMVVPRIMDSGDFPRPFKPSSITRAPKLLVTEAMTWQTLVNADTTAYKIAVQNMTAALQNLEPVLGLTVVFNLETDNLEGTRGLFAKATATFLKNRERMVAAIDSGTAIIADVAGALGTRSRFTRDQASSGDIFAAEIVRQSDETVRKLYLDTIGLLNGVGVIVHEFQPNVSELVEYQRLITDIRINLGAAESADETEQAGHAQRQQQPTTSPVVSTLSSRSTSNPFSVIAPDQRAVNIKGVYKWLAKESDAEGSLQRTQEVLAALRAVIAERQQKRDEGRRAMERLERMTTDVMRDAMTLLGTQARFSPQAGSTGVSQAIGALHSNADPALVALFESIKGASLGINKLRENLTLGAADITTIQQPTTLAMEMTNYLVNTASQAAQTISTELSTLRSAFLVADAQRRANVQRLEQLQRDLFATVTQQIAVLGGRIASGTQPSRLSEEVVAAITTWKTIRAQKNDEIINTLQGVLTLAQALGIHKTQFNAPETPYTLENALTETAAHVRRFEAPTSDAVQAINSLTTIRTLADETARQATFQLVQNTQRLDNLQRDLLQTVSRNIADLGERINTGVDPRNLTAEVNRAINAWKEKRIAKNAEIIAVLEGLRSMLILFGVPSTPPASSLPGQPSASASSSLSSGAGGPGGSLSQLDPTSGGQPAPARQDTPQAQTPIQRIDGAIRRVKSVNKLDSNFNVAIKSVETAVNTSNGAATEFVNKLSLVTRELDKFSKSTNELLDMVAKKTQLLFPGSTVLSTMGTISERLISILDQTALHNYNKSAAEINSRIKELNDAGALFGIAPMASTFPPLEDVDHFLRVVKLNVDLSSRNQQEAALAAQQVNVAVPALLEEMKANVQELNNALEISKRQTVLISAQAKEVKDETRDIKVTRLRQLAQERAKTLDATYDAAATAFVAAFIAFANNNTLPLRNAIATTLDPSNGIWGITYDETQSLYLWTRPQAFFAITNTFSNSNKLRVLLPHIAAVQGHVGSLINFLVGVQNIVLQFLNEFANGWYSNNEQAINTINTLLAGQLPDSVGDVQPNWFPVPSQAGPYLPAYFTFAVGAMMMTPAILDDMRNSTMSYNPTSDQTVAMLLAKQMAASVRGQVNIAAQRDEIIKSLNVVRDAVGQATSMTTPATLLQNRKKLADVLGPRDTAQFAFVSPAPVPSQAPLANVTQQQQQQQLPERTRPVPPGNDTSDRLRASTVAPDADDSTMMSLSIQSSSSAALPVVFSDGAF